MPVRRLLGSGLCGSRAWSGGRPGARVIEREDGFGVGFDGGRRGAERRGEVQGKREAQR